VVHLEAGRHPAQFLRDVQRQPAAPPVCDVPSDAGQPAERAVRPRLSWRRV
jgi:hypothetical protein